MSRPADETHQRGSTMLLRRKTFGAVLGLAWGLVLAIGGPAWAQQVAGVVVDADGVLRMKIIHDPTGMLSRAKYAEAKAVLAAELARPSKLRKISLNRLEAEIAERAAKGQGPTIDMQYLAGLTRVQYVFYYPETKDIVIAG